MNAKRRATANYTSNLLLRGIHYKDIWTRKCKTCVQALLPYQPKVNYCPNKVAGEKVYPRRNQNNKAHAESACIGL
jgi:hypothetical protein